MTNAKARNRKKITDGGITDASGARLRLKSLINHAKQLPTAIHIMIAIAGKTKPLTLNDPFRTVEAPSCCAESIVTCNEIVSIPLQR